MTSKCRGTGFITIPLAPGLDIKCKIVASRTAWPWMQVVSGPGCCVFQTYSINLKIFFPLSCLEIVFTNLRYCKSTFWSLPFLWKCLSGLIWVAVLEQYFPKSLSVWWIKLMAKIRYPGWLCSVVIRKESDWSSLKPGSCECQSPRVKHAAVYAAENEAESAGEHLDSAYRF